ncbi:hypothetical protein BTR25_05415 [Bacillus sp. MRMR6]|nr:hypothetical protein BTR25_05415 [Bacillus sp. MRMR6]
MKEDSFNKRTREIFDSENMRSLDGEKEELADRKWILADRPTKKADESEVALFISKERPRNLQKK